MGGKRYSEERLEDDFHAYILFSDHLQGRISEVFEAAREDYQELDWSTGQMGPDVLDTRGVTLSTDFGSLAPGRRSSARGETRFIGMPGCCELDWAPVIEKSRYLFAEGAAALARHTDHLYLCVGAPKGNTSLAARFDAARRMTCLAAVFARLPTSLGAYSPHSASIRRPEDCVSAAATAITGKVPVFQWVTMSFQPFGSPGNIERMTGNTIGLATFNGHEIVIPRAKLDQGALAKVRIGAVVLQLETNKPFEGSDTLSMEGEADPYRIRHMQEGRHGAQTDQWHLLHGSCDLDERKVFGIRSKALPPGGQPAPITRDWNSMKSSLYEFVAGADPRGTVRRGRQMARHAVLLAGRGSMAYEPRHARRPRAR